ncbi:hypothetical protein LINGRAPRIM_LOCUS2213, partial [Linum grandiflorum]
AVATLLRVRKKNQGRRLPSSGNRWRAFRSPSTSDIVETRRRKKAGKKKAGKKKRSGKEEERRGNSRRRQVRWERRSRAPAPCWGAWQSQNGEETTKRSFLRWQELNREEAESKLEVFQEVWSSPERRWKLGFGRQRRAMLAGAGG